MNRRTHDDLPLPEGYEQYPVRVLVTGSRTWTDEYAVIDALAFYWHMSAGLTVVHGHCPQGPDLMAHHWCHRMNSGAMGQVVKEEKYPAQWSKYGRNAGFSRNAYMVSLGADLCLAFMEPCAKPNCATAGVHGSHGTDHCATQAEKAGIETVIWRSW